MKKTCMLGGNFALDTIVTRDYPNGFVVGKSNKFTETIVAETVGNTCGNVACMLSYLGVQSFPIAHLDLSEQGLQIKSDLERYGADVRFVENSESGGTTLLRCTHKRDKTTGEHTVSFRATSPGSRFPKRRFLRVRDEAPAFMESLEFTPDVFFFDAAEAGLRYLAGELRKRGTLVYFEPESDADKNKFLKAVEVSDIIKFSHEKVGDTSFTSQYKDKLFIRTMGAEGLEFNLCGQGWVKVASVPNDNVVDWEGAGDWTTSQFIACLCKRDILSISQMTTNSVRECLEIACTTASHSVSYLGSKGMIDAERLKLPRVNICIMVVTKELLKSLFDEYNKLYFDGKLGKCNFSFFTKNLSILGSYNSQNDKNGKPKDKIWIGTSVKWTEEHLQRILIHEMIHMYVYRVEGHKHDGVLGHGWRFRRQCRRIRKNYGIEALKLPNVEFIDPKFYPKLWEKILLWIIDR